ncbi:MAG: hypothetical protein VXW87_02385 [Pseudomonadota bacterium]|nr:hypothetical protein [Pseudomonadota bacterium]
MIVQIHTILVSGEQQTQNIQSTDNFERTIHQNIQDSSKADVYASGITRIELTHDQHLEAFENLHSALTVTRIDDGETIAIKYDVPTNEMNSILSIKDSDQELCLEKIAQCVNQHCLNSARKQIVRFGFDMKVSNYEQLKRLEAVLSDLPTLFAESKSAAEGTTQDNSGSEAGSGPNKEMQL